MVVLRVAEANWLALRRSWRPWVLPSVVQPLVLIAVFAGLLGSRAGRFIRDVSDGPTLAYPQYAAIGIICSSAVVVAAGDITNATFTGFRFDERFRTVVTTPVSPAALAMGMMAWSFAQGAALCGMLFLLAAPILGFTALVRLPILMALTGLASAALSAPLAAVVARWHATPQVLNITGRVVLAPLVLFSATYFPTASLPSWATTVVEILPLAHATMAVRAIYAGTFALAIWDVVVVLAWFVAGAVMMIHFFRRELTA